MTLADKKLQVAMAQYLLLKEEQSAFSYQNKPRWQADEEFGKLTAQIFRATQQLKDARDDVQKEIEAQEDPELCMATEPGKTCLHHKGHNGLHSYER